MNWAGLSVLLGAIAVGFVSPPVGLVLAIGAIWLFRHS